MNGNSPGVLFVSNTANFSKFNLPFMRWFKEQGCQVDYVSLGEEPISGCDHQYAIPMTRNPFNVKNLRGYKELKKLLRENAYMVIHCHTPIGGFLTRLAARKSGTSVIYTAHGFHFYKGSPSVNWLIYYPIEKFLAKYTTALITINDEDYAIAKSNFSSCKNIYKVDGVGVDLKRFYHRNADEKRRLRYEFGYDDNDYIITNIAEIIKRKNQIMLIRALPWLKIKIPNLKVLFVGNDNFSSMKLRLENMVKRLRLENTVKFLGYRHDVDKLIAISDISFSASIQEGLPVNIIESMSCGVPIVCSKIRGHNSLITHGVSGLLFSNVAEMVTCILALYNSEDLAESLGCNANKHSKKYDINLIIEKMAEIYLPFLAGLR